MTIEILNTTLLDDYEIAGPADVTSRTTNCSGPTPEHYANLRIPLRRKPRLKRIVFTVAGEDRREIKKGEWFIGFDGCIYRADSDGGCKMVPLRREEVYE